MMQDCRSHLIAFMEARGLKGRVRHHRRLFHALLDGDLEMQVEDDPLRWPGSAHLSLFIGFLPYAVDKKLLKARFFLRRNLALVPKFYAGLKVEEDGRVLLTHRAGPNLENAEQFKETLQRLFALAKRLRQEWNKEGAISMPDGGGADVRFL